MTLQEAALDIAQAGYSVFPLAPRSKQPPPGFRWMPFMATKVGADSIKSYWTRQPDANVAVVCGRISNLIVIDIDPKGTSEADVLLAIDHIVGSRIGKPAVVRTGKGGAHLYYGHSSVVTKIGIPGSDLIPGLPKDTPMRIDLKADRSYVVGPGSIHPDTGLPYYVDERYPMRPSGSLPPVPEMFFSFTRDTGSSRTEEDWNDIVDRTGDGERNDNSIALAGLLFHHLPPQYWESVVKPLVRTWNQHKVSPPLESKQLENNLRWLESKERKHFEV